MSSTVNRVIVKSLDPADPTNHEVVEPVYMYAGEQSVYCVFEYDRFGGAASERWIPWHQVLDVTSIKVSARGGTVSETRETRERASHIAIIEFRACNAKDGSGDPIDVMAGEILYLIRELRKADPTVRRAE